MKEFSDCEFIDKNPIYGQVKHKNVLCFCVAGDSNWINGAKSLYLNCLENGWDEDVLILYQERIEEEITWFKERGCLVRKMSNHIRHGCIYKYWLFDIYMKQWDKVIYMDLDIIVKSKKNIFKKIKNIEGFYACKGPVEHHHTFEQHFDRNRNKELYDYCYEKYSFSLKKENGEERFFNSGFMVFSTNIIEEDTLCDILFFDDKYISIISIGDQSTLNIIFAKIWKDLDPFYNINLCGPIRQNIFLQNNKNNENIGVLHFLGTNYRQWHELNPFYNQWIFYYNKIGGNKLEESQDSILIKFFIYASKDIGVTDDWLMEVICVYFENGYSDLIGDIKKYYNINRAFVIRTLSVISKSRIITKENFRLVFNIFNFIKTHNIDVIFYEDFIRANIYEVLIDFKSLLNLSQEIVPNITQAAAKFGDRPFFYRCLQIFEPEIILEIGRWIGGSTCLLILFLESVGIKYEKIYSLDIDNHNSKKFVEFINNDGFYFSEEYSSFDYINAYMKEINKQNLLDERLLFINKNSLEFKNGFNFCINYIDFIIIDGDHSYNSVFCDLENSFESISCGGIIISHDMWINETRKAFLDFVEKKHKEIIYIDPYEHEHENEHEFCYGFILRTSINHSRDKFDKIELENFEKSIDYYVDKYKNDDLFLEKSYNMCISNRYNSIIYLKIGDLFYDRNNIRKAFNIYYQCFKNGYISDYFFVILKILDSAKEENKTEVDFCFDEMKKNILVIEDKTNWNLVKEKVKSLPFFTSPWFMDRDKFEYNKIPFKINNSKKNIAIKTKHSGDDYNFAKIFTKLGMNVFSICSKENKSRPIIDLFKSDISPFNEPIYSFLNKEANILNENGFYSENFASLLDIMFFVDCHDLAISGSVNYPEKIIILQLNGQKRDKELSEYAIKTSDIKNLYICCYSQREYDIISKYKKEVSYITWFVDCKHFKPIESNKDKVITFNNKITREGCFPDVYNQITNKLKYECVLYGDDNDVMKSDYVKIGGYVDYLDMPNHYNQAGCYLYMGTEPADYTYNFCEAMACGLPIVGYRKFVQDINQYNNEIDMFLDNYSNGFYFDNVDDILSKISDIMNDREFATNIGTNARKCALMNFGEDVVFDRWEKFLFSTGLNISGKFLFGQSLSRK